MTALAARATTVSSAENVKTALRYAPAVRDALIALLSVPNAAKNVKPAPMTSSAAAAVYAGIV